MSTPPVSTSSGTAAVSLRYGALPGTPPRLMKGDGDVREDRAAYEAAGGYGAGLSGPDLIAAVESSGLRGRGGAAFPAGAKLRSVSSRPGPRYVVANGEEGEPASVKDRWLLRCRPHLVLEGLLLAAGAVDAHRAYVYVSDDGALRSMQAALAEHPPPLPVDVVAVPRGYVAGEETAVVRALNGGPPKPRDKPPRPFEEGVGGHPTLVSNVETLANLPFIARFGDSEFGTLGSGSSPGTFLLTVSGACERPGLHEVPLGARVGASLEELAGFDGPPTAFLMGGFFAGILSDRALEMALAYDDLAAEGSGLGCGAIVIVGPLDCPVAAAVDVMGFFARENADQCGPCINGTTAMHEVLKALALGSADDAALQRLRRWSVSLRARGACAMLDGAANLAASLLREFPFLMHDHLEKPCPRCASVLATAVAGRSRFALDF